MKKLINITVGYAMLTLFNSSVAIANNYTILCPKGYTYSCDSRGFCGCQPESTSERGLTINLYSGDERLYPNYGYFNNSYVIDQRVFSFVDALRDVGATDEEIVQIGISLGILETDIEIALLLPAIQQVR